jgi:hypothetical protein
LVRQKQVNLAVMSSALWLTEEAAEEASRDKIKQESQEVNLRAVNAIKRSHSEVDGDEEDVEIVATTKKQCTAPKIIDLD